MGRSLLVGSIRRAVVLAAIATAVALVPAPARADAAPPAKLLNRLVSGPFAGTMTYEFGAHGCSFVFEEWDVTYTVWSGRTGTVHLEGCATITDSGSTFEYDGSYTLHAPGGGSLAGEFSGTTYPTLSLRLDVTTTEGGLFRDVTGQLLIEGDWSNTPSGTLTGHLVRPGPH